jgi:hypothetical protein
MPSHDRLDGVARTAAAALIVNTVVEGVMSENSRGALAYHSNQSLVDLEAVGVRSYISEPRSRTTELEEPSRGARCSASADRALASC